LVLRQGEEVSTDAANNKGLILWISNQKPVTTNPSLQTIKGLRRSFS
jgi:hypothetical protein